MAVSSLVGLADSDDTSRFERLILDNRSRFLNFLSYVYKSRGRNFIESVAQAAESRAWMRFGSFDPDQGSFITWLIRLARHEAKEEIRRWHFDTELSMEGLAESGFEPAVDGPSECYDTTELKRRLWQAVRELPKPVRFPFILHVCDGYSLARVAERLHLGKEKVRYRVNQAKRLLARRLGRGWNCHGFGIDWTGRNDDDGSDDLCAC